LERALRDAIEAGGVHGQVLLPALGVPQFEVVANAQKYDVMPKGGELHQPLGDQDAPAPIHVHRLHLGEIEPAEDAGFGIRRGSLVELLRKLLQTRLRVDPQGLIRSRRDEERGRVLEHLAYPFWQCQTVLVVESAGMGAGQQHASPAPPKRIGLPFAPTSSHRSPQL